MHFFPSCACVTILTKKPNKTVSTKNHQYLQYSNVMNNTSGALRMIQTNTKYQNTYWTLEQLKKKTKYTQQIKMKRQHITLIHKKNPQKLINTDQINLNKNLQYTKIYKLSTKTPSNKMRTGISCETKNANTVYRFPNPQ